MTTSPCPKLPNSLILAAKRYFINSSDHTERRALSWEHEWKDLEFNYVMELHHGNKHMCIRYLLLVMLTIKKWPSNECKKKSNTWRKRMQQCTQTLFRCLNRLIPSTSWSTTNWPQLTSFLKPFSWMVCHKFRHPSIVEVDANIVAHA